MLCQKCKQKQATVHIAASRGDPPFSDAAIGDAKFTLHFCEACGDKWQQEMFAETLFPNSGEQPITEQLRVIQSSPERTVLRLLRTESQPVP
jgi:protein-arginine kinase activator protein McsA